MTDATGSTGVGVPIRVGIVEDQRMVAESLSYVLGSEPDLELVGIATTKEEGVDLAAKLRPSVMLMDYVLPDGDGAETTLEVLRRSPETKVVMFSGMGGSELLLRAVEAGCVGLVSKNRPVGDVVAAVRSAALGVSILKVDELADLLAHVRTGDRSGPDALTARELDVLRMLSQACSTEAIAEELFLSVHTVRNHERSILMKLGAHSKLEAVIVALRSGVIPFSAIA